MPSHSHSSEPYDSGSSVDADGFVGDEESGMANSWKPIARELIKKGQGLEMGGDFTEAVMVYDRAVAILSELPRDKDSEVRRELAIAWMNRGNALRKQNSDLALENALLSYGRTIALLKSIPGRDESARVTLGCAYLNRAGVLQKITRLAEASGACDEAISILRDLPKVSDFHAVRMLAAALLTRGSIALAVHTAPAIEIAIACSRNSLDLVGPRETNDLTAADIALKSRQVFCEASGLKLAGIKSGDSVGAALGEASDCAETALKVVLHWERDGFQGFEWFGTWFFRFAASLYAEYQTQFLGEFMREYLRTDCASSNSALAEEWRNLAVSALSRARVRLHSLLFSDPKATESACWLDALKSLAVLEVELMAWKNTEQGNYLG